jgi:hypothetical protein
MKFPTMTLLLSMCALATGGCLASSEDTAIDLSTHAQALAQVQLPGQGWRAAESFDGRADFGDQARDESYDDLDFGARLASSPDGDLLVVQARDGETGKDTALVMSRQGTTFAGVQLATENPLLPQFSLAAFAVADGRVVAVQREQYGVLARFHLVVVEMAEDGSVASAARRGLLNLQLSWPADTKVSIAVSGQHMVLGFVSSLQPSRVWVISEAASGATFTYELTRPNTPAVEDSGFGSAVAIDGDRLVVGAPRGLTSLDGVGTSSPGYVYVYARQAASWLHESTLGGPSSPFALGKWLTRFGAGLHLSAGQLVVDSPNELDLAQGTVTRRVRTFVLGSSGFSARGSVTVPASTALAATGSRFIVHTGQEARIYTFGGQRGPQLETTLPVHDATDSVAIGRDVAFVGSPQVWLGSGYAGRVDSYLYRRRPPIELPQLPLEPAFPRP